MNAPPFRAELAATRLTQRARSTGILDDRRKLAAASWATRTCRCSHPLGVVDEDGAVSCVRCAYPLRAPSPVTFLPPAAA